MDKEQINKLKELAQRATPGPWGNKNYRRVYSLNKTTPRCICNVYSENDEAYIAAAHPIAIMELIEENKYLQAVVNGYKNANDEAQEIINELKAENARLEKDFDACIDDCNECRGFCPYDCIGQNNKETWRTAAREAVAEQTRKQGGGHKMSGIIIKRLRYFNHTAHKELWDWLAKNLRCTKDQWPGWKKYPEQSCWCFACETAGKKFLFYSPEACRVCPLVWGTEMCDSISSTKRGLYAEWYDCFSPSMHERKSALAAQIRDLPLRPDQPDDPFITVVI